MRGDFSPFQLQQRGEFEMNKQWKCRPSKKKREKLPPAFVLIVENVSPFIRKFPNNAQGPSLTGAHRWKCLADCVSLCISEIWIADMEIHEKWRTWSLFSLQTQQQLLFGRELFRSWSIHIEITRSAWHVPTRALSQKLETNKHTRTLAATDAGVGASYIEKGRSHPAGKKEDLRYVIEDYTSLHHHSSRAIHSVYSPQMDEGYILCWAVH